MDCLIVYVKVGLTFFNMKPTTSLFGLYMHIIFWVETGPKVPLWASFTFIGKGFVLISLAEDKVGFVHCC